MHEIFQKWIVLPKKADRREIGSEMNIIYDYYNEQCDGNGDGRYDYIQVYSLKETGKHFPDKHSAESYLYGLIRSDEADYSYSCTYDFPRSATYVALEKKINACRDKLEAYRKAHSVKAFKAAYVGCPFCGSKLSRILLKNENCPVCGNDLRSTTTLTTLCKYEKELKVLEKDLRQEEKDMKNKKMLAKNKAVYTLVAVTVDGHC